MRLLVSVRGPEEASLAVDGGADIIDAKEPRAGALGAVSAETLQAIVRVVAGRRPVTAALGDAADDETVGRLARSFVDAGADLVKVGFGGITDARRAAVLLASAAREAGRHRVIGVAYADHRAAASLTPEDVLRLAAREGLAGILLDTADKDGPGITELVPPAALAAWVSSARERGLLVAVAGKVAAPGIPAIAGSGADILGVRGAVCDEGRNGRVSLSRVRLLRDLVAESVAVGRGV